jgi:hypothetical protein
MLTGAIRISAESPLLTYFDRFPPRVVGMDRQAIDPKPVLRIWHNACMG